MRDEGRGCLALQADVRGPRGLTPMHLAALSPATAAISRLLVSKSSPGPSAWFWVAADDGLTPASFAERLGRPERNADMLQRAIAAGAPFQKARNHDLKGVLWLTCKRPYFMAPAPASFAERLGRPERSVAMLQRAAAAGAPFQKARNHKLNGVLWLTCERPCFMAPALASFAERLGRPKRNVAMLQRATEPCATAAGSPLQWLALVALSSAPVLVAPAPASCFERLGKAGSKETCCSTPHCSRCASANGCCGLTCERPWF